MKRKRSSVEHIVGVLKYANRIPVDDILQREIKELLDCPD